MSITRPRIIGDLDIYRLEWRVQYRMVVLKEQSGGTPFLGSSLLCLRISQLRWVQWSSASLWVSCTTQMPSASLTVWPDTDLLKVHGWSHCTMYIVFQVGEAKRYLAYVVYRKRCRCIRTNSLWTYPLGHRIDVRTRIHIFILPITSTVSWIFYTLVFYGPLPGNGSSCSEDGNQTSYLRYSCFIFSPLSISLFCSSPLAVRFTSSRICIRLNKIRSLQCWSR